MAKRSEVPTKPLFASAETISYSVKPEKRENEIEENDLENLNLNLASSTLEAILAVQQIPKPATQQSPFQSEKSSSENEERTCHVAQPMSEDEEAIIHQSTSKKRERSKERHKHKKKKKRKHKKRRSRSPSPDRRPSPSQIPQFHKGKIFLDDIPHLQPENAFQIDRKANKEFRMYESVSKFHIAKYKLACTACIGNDNIFVDFKARDGSEKTDKKKWKKTRYFDRDSAKHSWRKGFSCKSNSDSSKMVCQSEFIHIPKDTEENKNNNAVGSYSCLDDATSLYIQGKGKPLSTSTSDGDFIMDEIFEKVARFNQRTREEPHNVDLWLEFVKFQDTVALEDKSFKKQTLHLHDVYRPSKSVIEKKLSILEKAIEKNPSSLELKKAQLELYQDIWDSDKVHKAWEDLLFVHSSNLDLWRHYLSQQQSRLSSFSFSRMVKKYHQCFQILIPILDGQVQVVNKSLHLEEKLIGVFYQYCTFLHQCGYTERATASFQAMIEMNLFCPPSLNLSTSKERLDKFEAFWESPVPKFGDLNAKGWAKWEKKKEDVNKHIGFLSATSEKEEDSILAAALPRSLTWLKMEKARLDIYWLPWKPDASKGETEESCEDPDRLVLFEDISPGLFRLTKSEGCVQLVCLFLAFLGMNSNRMEKIVGRVDGIKKSDFNGYLLDKMHQIETVSFSKLSVDVETKWKPHECLADFIKQIILQAETYFVSSNRELFTLLRLDLELKKTGISNIQVMSASCCKEIKKIGKNLLKESQNRNNLVVWDTYIRLLWVLSDKMEETMSMINVALGMFIDSKSLSDPGKAKGICLLCRTFAEIMLNFEPLEYVSNKGKRTAPSMEDKHQVIGCMGALVENSKFKPQSKVDSSPLHILRIRKRMARILEEYVSGMENDCASSNCAIVNAYLQCYVLFEYCASSFQNANELFIATRTMIKNLSFTDTAVIYEIQNLLQDLYIAQISFISNVMHIESVPLSHIRKVIDEALMEFPESSHFHRAFWEVESGSFLIGRLRKFYDRELKSRPSVSMAVFATLSEWLRLEESLSQMEVFQSGVSDTGLVHRVRSLFQHILEIPVCAHCPLLWRMWLTFEVQHGQLTRAKGILYRALQSCPWAKSIYMDGVCVFGDEELLETCDLMTEKEIRVCMPLEEVDLLMNAEKQSGDEEGEPEDEEEKVPRGQDEDEEEKVPRGEDEEEKVPRGEDEEEKVPRGEDEEEKVPRGEDEEETGDDKGGKAD